MFDPTPASLAGVRRHDLPRSASGRAPAMPAEAGIAGLASSIDRHLAAARRTRQPLAVLTIAVRRCQQIDGEPVPTLLHPLALEAGQRLRARVRGTDTVLWSANNMVVDTAIVTLNVGGVAQLNGRLETIGALESSGGAGLVDNQTATALTLTLGGAFNAPNNASGSFSGTIGAPCRAARA